MLNYYEKKKLELIYYRINFAKLRYNVEKTRIKKNFKKELLKYYSELNDLRYVINKKIEDNIEDYDKENLIYEINEIDI
tara:strand:- start:713 stop:949 length:237 start_codon:yes stop_codon:yes gene_type:complete